MIYDRLWLGVILVMLGLILPIPGWGKVLLKSNPKAEAWVQKQVSHGNSANLLDIFSEEEDRVLSGSFLEKLLTEPSGSKTASPPSLHIRNAIITGTIDLRKTVFTQGIALTDCRFEDALLFSQCYFPHGLMLDDSSFLQEVDLHEIRSDDDLFLRKAVFQKSFDIAGSLIQGDLTASKARFLDRGQGVNCVGLEITQNAYFNQAIFEGPALFANLTIEGQLQANEAHFLDQKVGARFTRMFTTGLVSFNKAVFEGGADFSGSEINAQFQAAQARFTHPTSPALFDNMRVEENVILTKAIFQGPAHFTGMEIRNVLNLNETAFANPDAVADFSQLTARELYVIDIQMVSRLHFDQTTYQIMDAGDESGDYKNLLALLESADFCDDSYTRLETRFKKQGYPSAADQIYIAQKERERRERLIPYSFAWYVNWIYGKIAGHGRSPERILAMDAIIVLFGGFFIFRPHRMRPVDPYGEPFRNSYWYSLELFLPLIDLQTGQYWIPKPGRKWIRHYQRIHSLLGWILTFITILVLYRFIT